MRGRPVPRGRGRIDVNHGGDIGKKLLEPARCISSPPPCDIRDEDAGVENFLIVFHVLPELTFLLRVVAFTPRGHEDRRVLRLVKLFPAAGQKGTNVTLDNNIRVQIKCCIIMPDNFGEIESYII